jgi:hypothetical protein
LSAGEFPLAVLANDRRVLNLFRAEWTFLHRALSPVLGSFNGIKRADSEEHKSQRTEGSHAELNMNYSTVDANKPACFYSEETSG